MARLDFAYIRNYLYMEFLAHNCAKFSDKLHSQRFIIRFSNLRDSSSGLSRALLESFVFYEVGIGPSLHRSGLFIRPRASSAFIRYKAGNIVSQRERESDANVVEKYARVRTRYYSREATKPVKNPPRVTPPMSAKLTILMEY